MDSTFVVISAESTARLAAISSFFHFHLYLEVIGDALFNETAHIVSLGDYAGPAVGSALALLSLYDSFVKLRLRRD